MKKTVIAIVGPTAIGKTKLSIQLANYFNTVIISADSRQFYKEMSIGTAVPSAAELAEVKHYFIQHKSIFDSYSVGDYEKEVLAYLEQHFKTNDIIILVGGSGLYVDAVRKGFDTFPEINPNIRIELNATLASQGIGVLQQQLATMDPEYYQKVDLDNPQRLIRALEVCIGSGKPYSSFLDHPKTPRPFRTMTVGLTADRALIYQRIEQRVVQMVQEGLVDEAKQLWQYKHLNALQTVGYKELFNYFEKQCSLDDAISEIKKNTRRFAKRQLTWFKRNEQTHWINYTTALPEIIEQIETKL